MPPLLPLCLLAITLLGGAGCATSRAKAEREAAFVNTREIERRRMNEVQRGGVGSSRGAEILVPDEHRSFDPSTGVPGSTRKFGAGGARTKDFYFEQKARSGTFSTRDFYDAKSASATEKKFATSEANSHGKYAIPHAGTEAPTRSVETKEVRDAGKVASTRELWDADRQYLGPESQRLNTSIDQTKEVGWKGTIKPMTIEDIRELLNKNK